MKLKDYKTRCCNAEWYRKDRADYRCNKCDKDITLDLVLLQDIINKK
jgi:hypothetical protein